MTPRVTPDLRDTIVALSSAAGPGARAIVRLSGPDAVRVVASRWTGPQLLPAQRILVAGELALDGVASPLPADVEAGLDFADEDIHFVSPDDMLRRLAAGIARLINLQRQLNQRSVSDRPFRAVLIGRPNACKSSLFNALTGGSALVSPQPG